MSLYSPLAVDSAQPHYAPYARTKANSQKFDGILKREGGVSYNESTGELVYTKDKFTFKIKSSQIFAKTTKAVDVYNHFSGWLSKEIFPKLPRTLLELPAVLEIVEKQMELLDEGRDADRIVFNINTVLDVRRIILSQYIKGQGEIGQVPTPQDISEFIDKSGQIGKMEVEAYEDALYYASSKKYPRTFLKLGDSPRLFIDNFKNHVDDGLLTSEGVENPFAIAVKGIASTIQHGRIAIPLPSERDLRYLENSPKELNDAEVKVNLKKSRDSFTQLHRYCCSDDLPYPVPEVGFYGTPIILSEYQDLFEKQSTPLDIFRDTLREGAKITHINLSDIKVAVPTAYLFGYLCCPDLEKRIELENSALERELNGILDAIKSSEITLSYLKKLSLPSNHTPNTPYSFWNCGCGDLAPSIHAITHSVLDRFIDIIQAAPNMKAISLSGACLYSNYVSYAFPFFKLCPTKFTESNVGPSSFAKLAHAIQTKSSIEEIDLSYNNLHDEEGAQILRAVLTGIRENNMKLKSLILRGNSLGEESSKIITQIVRESPIVQLDIDENCFVGDAIDSIIQAMGYRSSLQKFSFNGNVYTFESSAKCAGCIPIPCIKERAHMVVSESTKENARMRIEKNASYNNILQVIVNLSRQGYYAADLEKKIQAEIVQKFDQAHRHKQNAEAQINQALIEKAAVVRLAIEEQRAHEVRVAQAGSGNGINLNLALNQEGQKMVQVSPQNRQEITKTILLKPSAELEITTNPEFVETNLQVINTETRVSHLDLIRNALEENKVNATTPQSSANNATSQVYPVSTLVQETITTEPDDDHFVVEDDEPSSVANNTNHNPLTSSFLRLKSS
jgi:hypothetical protein